MKTSPTEQALKELIKEAISKSMSYTEFRKLVTKLADNNGTTGSEQTEANRAYTVLNDQRMHRWDKRMKIPEEVIKQVAAYQKKVYWLVITESWCGDSAPSLPVINKVAMHNDGIDLRIVLRNEQPALMDAFLTNQKMSIPKLIIIDQDTSEVLGTWGPLPSKATLLANEYKKLHGSLSPEFKEDLQKWFNKDKGQNLLGDVKQLLALE